MDVWPQAARRCRLSGAIRCGNARRRLCRTGERAAFSSCASALGLFFAASLRYLVHGACRLRIKIDDVEWHAGLGGLKAGGLEWHPVTGDGVSFREFLAGHGGGEPVVSWSEAAPGVGEVCVLAGFFFPFQEVMLLTPGLAADVLAFVQPGRPRGLFGRMLGAEGQVEDAPVDVASVFLEGLVQAVDERALRVNTRVNGHVFITSEFWFVTTPIGLDCVRDFLRNRREGGRYELQRHEIFNALYSDGHLVGTAAMDKGNAVRVYEVDVEGWEKVLELNGLAISVESLPAERKRVPPFEGTVVFKKEIAGGNDEG